MSRRSTIERRVIAVAGAVLACAAGIALGALGAVAGERPNLPPAPSGPFDGTRAIDDLEQMIGFGPRPAGSEANRRQARWVARQLRRAGTRGVQIQRPHRNIVGRIPGSRRGAIVVGAHHDTWPGDERFVGANDGASGAAVVLGLARALPRRVDGPAVHFAFFDAEEARPGRSFEADGARGSRQYVRLAGRARAKHRQGTPRRAQIQAAVIADMVGDCDLEIPLEAGSDQALYAAVREAAGSDGPFSGRRRGEILDDHTPFARRGIPAVDLIDFEYPPWHTRLDRRGRVCQRSLTWVGEALYEVLESGTLLG